MPYIPVSIVRAHIQQLTTLAVAESTSKSYARGWCMFERFVEQYHVNMNSIKEHNLLEFISFLSLSGFAASTVQLYLTGVRHHLKLQGRNSFKDSFVIKMVVKGVSSRYSVPDIRLPINITLLHDMWNILPIVLRNPYMVKLYRSMFTLAYHGLLRPGEVTYTPHAIKVQHVYFVYENVHLYLHSSKTKTGPFPQKVVVVQGLFARVGSGDPVRVLRLFHNNYTGYCCIHLLCITTYNLSLPRLSANYYGLPTTVQLRAAHKNRCSRVGVSRSTASRYCTVPA